MDEPRVVIVGAGFGGLAAAKALADAPVAVTVIDRRNHHTFQPLLYQVATAGLDVDDICYTTRGIFHRQSNATALQATIAAVDFKSKRLTATDGLQIPYDHLVLAMGAVTADFGVPGVEAHAFGLKSGAEALRIRSHVLKNFERADRMGLLQTRAESGVDEAARQAAMTIVLVGGGPTGVEMAGGFAELIDCPLRHDYPNLDTGRARVILVEGQDRLLASFAPKLATNALKRLRKMNVEVLLSTQVAAVEANSVHFSDGSSIMTNTVVWAAGVRADPLAERFGLETSRGGRVVVDEHLRVPTVDGVYAIGDLAASPTTAGEGPPAPQVAAGAIQGGQHVAKVIRAASQTLDPPKTGSSPKLPKPFSYRDKGSMATIGRNAAVVELPSGLKITGFAGWTAWLALHLVMLIGFRNRANVLVNWAWNYLTYDRGSRLIIEPDDSDDPGRLPTSLPGAGS